MLFKIYHKKKTEKTQKQNKAKRNTTLIVQFGVDLGRI